MAQEEHILLSSSHSGGCADDSGSSDRSRNVRQKKVPQRGLGVAQLEKIRLEEERKRETLGSANVLANNAIDSVNDAAPCLGLSPSPANYRSPPPPSPSIPIQINGGAEDTGSHAISSSGNGGWCRLWNGDYNLGAAFQPQAVNLQLDSNSAAALAPMPHRFFRFQQPASPVVNSSLPSAVLASQMEPPSNQNVHGNNYASSWQEEYKMVGVKRAYPFSLESPFTGHFDPSSVATKSRFDEKPSCSSRYTAQKEPRNMYTRDGPSKPREVLMDDARLNGDFLSLAPPAAALPPSNSKHKYPTDNSGSHGPEENRRSQVYRLGASRSREEPFSFFPVRSDSDETSGCTSNANGEKGETIDLNLKL